MFGRSAIELVLLAFALVLCITIKPLGGFLILVVLIVYGFRIKYWLEARKKDKREG